MKLRRLSFLATAALCALPVLAETRPLTGPQPYDAESAARRGTVGQTLTGFSERTVKKKEKTVGTVKIEGGGSVRINGKTAGNGASLSVGDLIETTESVTVTLASGVEYVIDPGSRVRLTRDHSGVVRLLVIYGGVHPVGAGDDTIDPLPFLAAFGFGNSSFPSIGGGNSSNSNVVSVVLPSGAIAFFDSTGKFVRFN